jgi:hypothetical protein
LLKILGAKVAYIHQMLSDLQQRDDSPYRVIFETQPLSDAIRNGGIGRKNRFRKIRQKALKKNLIVDMTWKLGN